MSQANVEVIRRGFDHFMATGEPPWEIIDEEVEVYDHDTPDQGDYRGHAGYASWLEDWGAAWAEWSIEPEEYIDAGDWIVVPIRMKTKGLGSGIEVERQDAMVWEMRASKIVRLDYYNDRKQALESVGLPEQGRSEGSVEIVRSAFLALADRGFDGLAEFLHPDINWRAMEGAPDDVGEMQGMEAARHYVEDWFETFDDFMTIPEELLDAGEDRVVGVLHVSGCAKLSGITTELRYAALYTLRDDKIARIREYADREEALEAVGLAE